MDAINLKFLSSFKHTLFTLAFLLSACGGGGGGSGGSDDNTAPTVTSNTPIAAAVDVAIDIMPSATFSEAMSVESISTNSFTLVDAGATPVNGTVNYNNGNFTASFDPAAALVGNSTYTATVTSSVKDEAGNPLAANFSWSFTTVSAQDVTAPAITSNTPADAATSVAINVIPTVTFSESMDAASITTTSFTLLDPADTPIVGTVSYDNNSFTASFTPSSDLANSSTYTATVTSAMTDASGNALAADFSWGFTTVAADVIAPTVVSNNPLHLEFGALVSEPITATFTEALDPTTVSVSSFIVTDNAGVVSGTVELSPDGLTASFTPQTNFRFHRRYDLQLTTAITDLAGNPLATDYVWHFNTGKRVAAGRAHTCARLEDGGLKCWGGNFDQQLGLGDMLDRGDEADEMGANLPRVDLGTGRKVLQVVAGQWHTCARLDDHSVKCWGPNNLGQLGLGDTNNRGGNPGDMGDNLPVVNLGTNRIALELAAGGVHTCARLDNNSVKCWGYNNMGQLGLGDTLTRGDEPGEMGDNLPAVLLGSGRSARELAAGFNAHTCARLNDATVKCWGYNLYGQLGQGHNNNLGDNAGEMGNALPAIELGTGRTALGIEAGYNHVCARLDDESVKCWGSNDSGELGLGDADYRGDNANEMGDNLPAIDLGTSRTALGLSLGNSLSCVRLDNDTLKCWGDNIRGQLGQGDQIFRGNNSNEIGDALPAIDFGTNRTIRGASTGDWHSCALLDDNSIKCWGYNYAGQLGLGDIESRGDEANEMGDDLLPVDAGN